MRRAAIAGVLALAVVIGGCGGDGKKSLSRSSTTGDATTTSAATTTAAVGTATTPTTTPPSKGGDQRKADAALLRLSDLPRGWRQAPVDTSESPDPNCPDVKAAKVASTARGREPDFVQGVNTKLQHVVYVFPSAGIAKAQLKGISSSRLRDCLGRVTAQIVSGVKGVSAGEPSNVPLDVPDIGDERSGFRVTVPLTAQGRSANLNQDVGLVRVGRAISVIAVATQAAPLEAPVRNGLIRAAVRRLQAAF